MAIPNMLQHRTEAVWLADPSRAGRVRVLTVHLVDPRYRLRSTRNMPPQQFEWWVGVGAGRIDWTARDMPQKLADQILGYVDEWPMEAEETSRRMDERLEDEKLTMKAVASWISRYTF